MQKFGGSLLTLQEIYPVWSCFMADSRLSENMPEAAQLFFYVADEGENALSLGRSVTEIYEKSLLAFGSRHDVGDWELHLKSNVTS